MLYFCTPNFDANMNDQEAFYKKLKEQLEDTSTFPLKYLFKFILPSDNEKVKKLENIFNHNGAVITTKKSKTGKYTSVSIHVIMDKADDIINKYLEAGKIKGIISL